MLAALRLARERRRAGHHARRRFERARVGRGVRGLVHPAARRRGAAGRTTGTCAPTRRSRSTAWCAGRSMHGAPASRPGPARRERSAAHLRQRALRRTAHRRSGHRGAAGDPRRRARTMSRPRQMAFGYDRSRLQRHGRGAVVGDFRVSPGDPARAARRWRAQSLAFRKRTQPLDTPSAGCIFQNPDAGPRRRCPTASRGRPARSSIGRA